MGEPYRTGYRVEETAREPDAAEMALVHERRARHRAIARTNELGRVVEVLLMCGFAVLAAIVGAVLGKPAVIFAGTLVAAVTGVIGGVAWRKANQRLAARRGPWDTPDDEWRTHETRIVARSVVYAASPDEDYITWALFEIPGGEWVAIDTLWIPPREGRVDLARADVRLTWLAPNGECLGAEAHGDPLPTYGAARLADPDPDGAHFAEAIERGFAWSDEPLVEELPAGDDPNRRVPENALPQWMRDAVRAN